MKHCVALLKSTTKSIIDRRHGTQWGKLKAFYELLHGFSYHNKINLLERYLTVGYFQESENNSLETAKQIESGKAGIETK